jgi:hypothetical protein
MLVALYYLLQVSNHWHGRNGWEKSKDMKGARSLNR